MNASSDQLVVTGIGMRCSIGQNAELSCAAIRAGICRFADWPYVTASIGGEEVGIVGAAVVPDLGDRDWIEKAEDVARQPLTEAIWSARLHDLADPDGETSWGMYVAVPPEDRPGVNPENAQELAEDLEEKMFLGFEPPVLEVFPHGNAGSFLALEKAATDLTTETVDVAVVGGIDSRLESDFLFSLLADGRLKTDITPAGMIPGEAAAFFVVETAQGAAARNAQGMSRILPVRTSMESAGANGEPSTGAALAQALRESLSDVECDHKRIHRVIADINGERSRFLEWALADSKALNDLAPEWQLWHPADSVGDIGAATGASFVCIAVRAFQRSYAVGDAIVMSTASGSGQRAVTSIVPASQA